MERMTCLGFNHTDVNALNLRVSNEKKKKKKAKHSLGKNDVVLK